MVAPSKEDLLPALGEELERLTYEAELIGYISRNNESVVLILGGGEVLNPSNAAQ